MCVRCGSGARAVAVQVQCEMLGVGWEVYVCVRLMCRSGCAWLMVQGGGAGEGKEKGTGELRETENGFLLATPR